MRETRSLIYLFLSVYAVLISWHYNHSILWAIWHFIVAVPYLIYELIQGHLAHGLWQSIPASYF